MDGKVKLTKWTRMVGNSTGNINHTILEMMEGEGMGWDD